MATGQPHAFGARAPAPLRVSIFIAGASSILLVYGVVTAPGAGLRDLVVAATPMFVLWSGALFDWFVSRSTRVQPATRAAPMQVAPRPSRVPPSPTRFDRAA